MKERGVITIDINTARKWYKGEDESLRKLAKQAFTIKELEEPNLPKSWEEYNNYSDYNEFVESIRRYDIELNNLRHLIILRDVYRQGWKPNWSDKKEVKYCVYNNNVEFVISAFTSSSDIFSFPTMELAKQFLENFKDELEQLKELL